MFFSRKGLGDITSPLSLKFFHTGFWVLFCLTYFKKFADLFEDRVRK